MTFNPNRVRISVNSRADLPPPPVPGALRRAVLANAHANYLSASPPLSFHELEVVLRTTGIIAETDHLVTVSLDSTTIIVEVQTGELIEIDAYGNIVRGQG